ncbi:MAG: response regulator transcription factor, partial [Candidatus Kryptoniota bacterium]
YNYTADGFGWKIVKPGVVVFILLFLLIPKRRSSMFKAVKKILVIDDEADVARSVQLTIQLQEPSWQVLTANNGERGLILVDTESPDLVLLDLAMPDMSGFQVLEQIRQFSDIPVIILTVQNDELDKVRGLELGADDYIVKPFGHLELIARIHSTLRRVEGFMGQPEKPYLNGDLKIDFNSHQVYKGEKKISLTSTEFHLLEILARNAGKLISNESLLGRVWGQYALDNPDYLKVYMHRLRQKIEDDPSHPIYIHTERGEGYWLESPLENQ